ncbi:MAG TPA: hypothetical protein VF808_14660 [Ktedonobacterales bacterium]
MPLTDRNWLSTRRTGYVMIALAIVCWLAYAFYVALRARSIAPVLENWQYAFPALAIALLGYALIHISRDAEARQRLRERALAGDTGAMPLADVSLRSPMQEAATADSLALLWRAEADAWFAWAIALLAVALTTLVGAGVLENAVARPSTSLWLAIAAPAVALEMSVAVWWWLRWRRAPRGVVADASGLRWLRPGRREVFVPWNEARLFEVWCVQAGQAAEASGYALFGANAIIQWRDYPRGKAQRAADGVDYDAMWRRSQALVQMIVARTGLAARTSAPALAARDSNVAASAQHAKSQRRGALIDIALRRVAAAAVVATAMGALLVPLTPSLALNLYAAVTFAALGVALMVRSQRAIARTTPSDQPRVDALYVKLPPPPAHAGRLCLRPAHLWLRSAALLATGVLAAGDGYVAVQAARAYRTYPVAARSELLWWTLCAAALITWGVVLVTIRLAFETRRRYIADEHGVRLSHMLASVAIPWDMVSELEVVVARGQVTSYRVTGPTALSVAITWPAGGALDGVALAPGESPGTVFAAAVAQRAGVTPRVVYK